jgi:hypothetical protein
MLTGPNGFVEYLHTVIIGLEPISVSNTDYAQFEWKSPFTLQWFVHLLSETSTESDNGLSEFSPASSLTYYLYFFYSFLAEPSAFLVSARRPSTSIRGYKTGHLALNVGDSPQTFIVFGGVHSCHYPANGHLHLPDLRGRAMKIGALTYVKNLWRYGFSINGVPYSPGNLMKR